MLERLQSLEARYDELNQLLSDPEVISDVNTLREYSKEQSGLEDAVQAYREYKNIDNELKDAKKMLEDERDDDMEEMVKAEITELKNREIELEEELKILLLPKDPNDDKDVFVEIRGAAGGDEAALFAGNIYRLYWCCVEVHD